MLKPVVRKGNEKWRKEKLLRDIIIFLWISSLCFLLSLYSSVLLQHNTHHKLYVVVTFWSLCLWILQARQWIFIAGIPEKTVVWTANRDGPPVSSNATLRFASVPLSSSSCRSLDKTLR